MGHSDSSAHVSGYGGVCRGDERIAEAAAEARRGDLKQDSVRKTFRSAGKWILLLFVRIYQVFLSPFFGGACKFYPSCSRYGYEAIARHGAWRGSVLAMKRLLRCRPFTKGGFDPVPDVEDDVTHQDLQGLKSHRLPIAIVSAEAATYKNQEWALANDARDSSFADGIQRRSAAFGAEDKPLTHGAQGKQEFAQ